MCFDLTPQLLDAILTAMETQGARYAVNASSSYLEEMASEYSDGVHRGTDGVADGYYPIPKWGSDEGYALREGFVSSLHAPWAKERLQEALHSGRGVFRAFKDAMKPFPAVDKVWHRYKRQHMTAVVEQWYDALREDWGLERLAHSQVTEDDGDLLRDDFVFCRYDAAHDRTDVCRAVRSAADAAMQGSDTRWSVAAKAIAMRWERETGGVEASGIVCRLPDGEASEAGSFVGCVTYEVLDGVMFITSVFVTEEWRGLGIGRHMMESVTATVDGEAVCRGVAVLPIVDDALAAMLAGCGFVNTSAGYMIGGKDA